MTAEQIAWTAFRCGFACLIVFIALGILGTMVSPPIAHRTDPLAIVWQWLLLSSIAGGSLAGMVALVASLTAAVSRRYRPRI